QDKIKATRHELVFEAQQLIDATKHSFTQENISAIAHAFLNVPYLWGGRSSFGIDCSGYVQQVFKFFNMQLPRDAYQQAECGEPIGFLQETKCGDLV
ncbi:NlpC/P60 family protein, partial [Acinetobacter baumannii]